MTTAVCLKCGSLKFGAFNSCDSCGFAPSTDDELIRSTAMTDHYFSTDVLRQMGNRIASGLPVELDPASYENLRKGLVEARSPKGGSKGGFLSGLFRREQGTEGYIKNSPAKMTWTIVTTNIGNRMFRLQGTRRSIDVAEMTLVSIIIGAKAHGWDGGNGFFEIHGSKGVLRRITDGMEVVAEEAKGFGITFYDFVQKETDSDAGIRKGTLAEDFLKLCLEGNFRIVEVSK